MATNIHGIPVFDEHGAPLFPHAGGRYASADGTVFDQDRNGEPLTIPAAGSGDAPAQVGQPVMGIRIAFLRALMVAQGALPAPPPVAVPVFARNPAKVDRDVIDYKSKSGEALYKQATKSLYGDSTDQFALDSAELLGFVDDVARRAKSCGWNLFEIPNTAGDIKDLLSQHGELSLDEIFNHIEPITTAGAAREAQEDEQLYQMLMNSLSKEAKNKVSMRVSDFSIGTETQGCFCSRSL